MSILNDIRAEIMSAEKKHGPLPIHNPGSESLRQAAVTLEVEARSDLDFPEVASALAVLAEEVGEVASADTPSDLRAELVQVVAVGIRWIGQIDGIAAADCIPATAHPSIMAALGLPADDPPANALEQIRWLREEHADLLAISDAYQHMHTRAVRSEARLSALLAPAEGVDLEGVLRPRRKSWTETAWATIAKALDERPVLAREVARARSMAHDYQALAAAREGEIDRLKAALKCADEQGAEAIERVSRTIIADRWNSTAEAQAEVKRLTARLAEVERERDELRRAIAAVQSAAFERPWGLFDVLDRLVEGTDHLFQVHGCDAHGYETLMAARDAAREMAPALSAAMLAADKAQEKS